MLVFTSPEEHYKPKSPCYILNYPNPTSEFILRSGIFEGSLIAWCAENYAAPDKTFVDIGAHMGTYTINLAPRFREVHAFEAQRMTFYQLCGGIALNGLTNVAAHHFALGPPEQSGCEMELNIVSLDGGGSTLRAELLPNLPSIIATEQVEMRALDNFGLANVGLIKIDVEGSELAVLRGAVATLEASNFPPILFEAWAEHWYAAAKAELFAFLASLGYAVQPIRSSDNMFLASRT